MCHRGEVKKTKNMLARCVNVYHKPLGLRYSGQLVMLNAWMILRERSPTVEKAHSLLKAM